MWKWWLWWFSLCNGFLDISSFLITDSIYHLSSPFFFSSLFLLLWMYSNKLKTEPQQVLLSLLIFHFSFYASSSKRVSSSSFVLIWFSSFSFPSGFCLLIRLVGGCWKLQAEEERRNDLNFGIQKLNKCCSGKYQID